MNGPSFLRRPDIAGLVATALRDGEHRFGRYQLHAFVIMPNHVHALVTPHVVATEWLGPSKGFSAHLANQILGHVGQPFWQDESYDHLVRSDSEFGRIHAYIEQNPVTAGLAATAGEFEWSSAHGSGAACVGRAILPAAAFQAASRAVRESSEPQPPAESRLQPGLAAPPPAAMS